MSQKKIPLRLKAFALILLVFQTTTLVLTMRFSQVKSSTKSDRYLVSTAVVMGEVFKMVMNLFIIYSKEFKFRFTRFFKGLYKAFITEYKESLKISITAIIYVFQNNLLYTAAANLDAATYQVSYQSKILTTAVFSVVLPVAAGQNKKRLSCQKWISLLLLTIGVMLVQLNKVNEKEKVENTKDTNDQNFILGLVAILTAACTSGFAGIYFERVMKGGSHSMWFRNLESAVYSIIFGIFTCYKDIEKIENHPDGFFQNYDKFTWAVIFLQAIGGMIIVAVVNYTDNIIKCFANACSILTSALASYFILGDFHPTVLFMVGALVVCFSVFLYTSQKEYVCASADRNGDLLPRYYYKEKKSDEITTPRSRTGTGSSWQLGKVNQL